MFCALPAIIVGLYPLQILVLGQPKGLQALNEGILSNSLDILFLPRPDPNGVDVLGEPLGKSFVKDI